MAAVSPPLPLVALPLRTPPFLVHHRSPSKVYLLLLCARRHHDPVHDRAANSLVPLRVPMLPVPPRYERGRTITQENATARHYTRVWGVWEGRCERHESQKACHFVAPASATAVRNRGSGTRANPNLASVRGPMGGPGARLPRAARVLRCTDGVLCGPRSRYRLHLSPDRVHPAHHRDHYDHVAPLLDQLELRTLPGPRCAPSAPPGRLFRLFRSLTPSPRRGVRSSRQGSVARRARAWRAIRITGSVVVRVAFFPTTSSSLRSHAHSAPHTLLTTLSPVVGSALRSSLLPQSYVFWFPITVCYQFALVKPEKKVSPILQRSSTTRPFARMVSFLLASRLVDLISALLLGA